MWAGSGAGAIHTVASDHAPRLPKFKEPGKTNIFVDAQGVPIPFGAPSLETLAPLVWHEGVVKRGLPPQWMARALSGNPAPIFALFPGKGPFAGAITIGQAPRDDIAGEMDKVLGAGVRLVQAGALDGLSRSEIDALAPAPGDDDALIARLREGREILLSKKKIVPRLQACIDRLWDGVDAFGILFSRAFPPFTSARRGVVPQPCLATFAASDFDRLPACDYSPFHEHPSGS